MILTNVLILIICVHTPGSTIGAGSNCLATYTTIIEQTKANAREKTRPTSLVAVDTLPGDKVEEVELVPVGEDVAEPVLVGDDVDELVDVVDVVDVAVFAEVEELVEEVEVPEVVAM
jgi:hypothetical protein